MDVKKIETAMLPIKSMAPSPKILLRSDLTKTDFFLELWFSKINFMCMCVHVCVSVCPLWNPKQISDIEHLTHPTAAESTDGDRVYEAPNTRGNHDFQQENYN